MDDTQAANLAKQFKSRNGRDILEALGTVLSAQTERANRALKAEQVHNDDPDHEPKFSPEVTKMLATIFDQGRTLAQLIDPTIGVPIGRGGRKVIEASLSHGNPDLGGSPREFAAGVAKELESMGHDITKMSEDEVKEALARLVPSGSLTTHVADDDQPSAPTNVGHRGNAVVGPSPTLRATPRFDP